jgi:hypothetical protein
LVLLSVLVAGGGYGAVAKTSLCRTPSLRPYLTNSNLEAQDDNGFAGWRPWQQGYEVEGRLALSGGLCARCRNASAEDKRGLTCVVELNQVVPAPIVAEAWSRAEDVPLGGDRDYVLYLDINYADGSALWGQTAPFRSGTHDWQRATLTFVPPKPVRAVGVTVMLQARTGTVWFDDIQLWSADVPRGAQLFDGLPVVQPRRSPAPQPTGPSLKTKDGLSLTFDAATGQPTGTIPCGLFVRDATLNSDFVQPRGSATLRADGSILYEGQDDDLGLRLSATYHVAGGAIRLDGELTDLTGQDRGVTVYFSYPVDALGWLWLDDVRVARRIEAGGHYANLVGVGVGANGLASHYPFGCIAGQAEGLAMGAPLDVPRLWRFGYDAESREMYAAVDLGLSRDTAKFPSEAGFSLILYRFDAAWGFRSALQRYYEIFPHCFTKRNKEEGIWITGLTEYSKMDHPEDFGFRFREGLRELDFAARQGLYSFVYTEPMSMWLSMPAGMARTKAQSMAYLERRAAEGDRVGQIGVSSVLHNENGEPIGGPANQPWCDGYFLYMNPDPDLPSGKPGVVTKGQFDVGVVDHALRRAAQRRSHAWENVQESDRILQDGYGLVPDVGRQGTWAVKIVRRPGEDNAGAQQRVVLNQAEPRPLTARVWTKGTGVTGDSDINYALYLDAEYADGSPGWGLIVVPADTKTNDWQLLEHTVTPAKPVRSITYHLLLRAPHTGEAIFDEVFLGQTGSDKNLLADGNFEPGPDAVPTHMDGTYMDCFGLWAPARNYRREHFASAAIPLVFDSEGRVCELMIFAECELCREVAARMGPEGRMIFANGAVDLYPWGAAWTDVMGEEVNWLPGGRWSPEPDAGMVYRRSLSARRPFLVFLNVDWALLTPEMAERYMKRCAAYGFFPSMFTGGETWKPYWDDPALYNRDRPLFKRYVPVIKALGAAGWEPVTYARSDDPRVYVERFGRPGGPLYLTIYNDSDQARKASVSLDGGALGARGDAGTAVEALSGNNVPLTGGRTPALTLQPWDVKVLCLGPG